MPPMFSPAQAPDRNADAFIDWANLIREANSRPAAWSPPEAFFAILFAAATCDGAVSAEEQAEFAALIHRSRALRSLSAEDLQTLNVAVVQRFSRDRADALAAACAALPADMRLAAFAHALDLVLCDGELIKEEAAFLNALVAHLQLERGAVERIADVIMLKNKY